MLILRNGKRLGIAANKIWKGKNEQHVKLMQLDKSNIWVADYLTALPTQKVLQEKLHRAVAVEIARNRMSMIDD